MNYVVDRRGDKAWEWNVNKTQRMETSTEQDRRMQQRERKKLDFDRVRLLITTRPFSACRCRSISRLAHELIRGRTHLNDGGSGDCADALRAYVENSLKNADVAGHHEATCDGWIDVTAADVTESLKMQSKRREINSFAQFNQSFN